MLPARSCTKTASSMASKSARVQSPEILGWEVSTAGETGLMVCHSLETCQMNELIRFYQRDGEELTKRRFSWGEIGRGLSTLPTILGELPAEPPGARARGFVQTILFPSSFS